MKLVIDVLAILGGSGVVIFALSRFLGGVWQDRLKETGRRDTEAYLESQRQQYAYRRVQADKYSESQFEIYKDLWKQLQSLNISVEALWVKPTKTNIEALAKELETTKKDISNWSIFFEKSHLSELENIFDALDAFQVGKISLVDIRSRQDMGDVYPEAAEYYIKENAQFKKDFDQILDKLCDAFRNKLSQIESPDPQLQNSY